MKKISAFAAVLWLLVCAGWAAQETYILKVKVQTANLRAEADTNGAVIKQVKLGTLLDSSRKIGEWYEISTTNDMGDKIVGYINANVVDVVSTGKKPEPVQDETRNRAPVRTVTQDTAPVTDQGYVSSTSGIKILGGIGLANMTYTLTGDTGGVDPNQFKKARMGFGGGLGFEFGSSIGFEIDLLYLQKGVRFQGAQSGTTFDLNINIDEVSVPFLLKFHLMNKAGAPDVYLQGGGEIAYVIQSKADYSFSDPSFGSQSGTSDFKENINKLDYGLVLGGGVGIPMGGAKLCLEVRYHLGLANLEKTNAGFEDLAGSEMAPKTNALMIMGGIKF